MPNSQANTNTITCASLAAVQGTTEMLAGLPTRPVSPLDAEVRKAGRKFMALRMTRVIGEPDKADADNLISDLEALWQIMDPLILAVGKYAQSTLGISGETVAQCFTDQVRGALEGNATFEIEHAAKVRIEAHEDTVADHARGLQAAE